MLCGQRSMPALDDGSTNFVFVLVQKGSNAKEESYCCTEPDKIGPSLPLKTMKSKKEHQVFNRDNFVLP
jgi:hypothetical protein